MKVTLTLSIWFRNEPLDPISSELKPEQKRAFERIIQKVKNTNIKIVLVQSPVSKTHYISYPNNKKIDEYFKSLGIYYNFNKILNLANEPRIWST